jgi:hypothetical protein
MDMSSAGCVAVMNKESYAKLPEKIKEALPGIREKMPYVSQEALAGKAKVKKWREQFRSKGIEIIEFPESERNKMKERAAKFWEEWIVKWEKAGVKDAREGLNLVKNLISIVEREYPQRMLDVPDEIVQQVAQIEADVKAGKGK